jgi:IS5 family transposase
MFRMLVLQSLYSLSDEQVEYQVRDRLSFTRFLRLGIEYRIPDGTTLWLFRESLGNASLIEKLFERFGQHLDAEGLSLLKTSKRRENQEIFASPEVRDLIRQQGQSALGRTPRPRRTAQTWH